MEKVLILDLDGVLYRWHNAVYEYFKLYRNYCKTFECLWSVDYLKFSKEDWNYLTNIDILYSSQLPTKDCMDFLNYVKYRYTIYYLTGRPLYVKTTTEQFLKRYRFPFRDCEKTEG
jgi:FMN phosphatase YigB (HAD superfamily)